MLQLCLTEKSILTRSTMFIIEGPAPWIYLGTKVIIKGLPRSSYII
jgi:hypothetical protein